MNTYRTTKFYKNVLASGLGLTLVEWLMNLIFGNFLPLKNYAWILLSCLLVAIVLASYIIQLNTKNWQRAFVIAFIVSFTIGSFNILIESLIFHITTVTETLTTLFQGSIRFGFLCFLLTYLFQDELKKPVSPTYKSRSILGWSWRIMLSAFVYIVVYLIAGMILQASLPALGEFYKGKLPSMSLLFNTQILRGLIFTGIGLLFMKTCRGEVYKKAALLGLIFSILGGIAPLIPINEFMPLDLRIGHGFEVGISNFIYGFVVGMIINQPAINTMDTVKS